MRMKASFSGPHFSTRLLPSLGPSVSLPCARVCGCWQVKRGRKDEEYDDESDEDEEHKTTLREEVPFFIPFLNHLLQLLYSTRHASQPLPIL